jgi:hypothetical protein
MIFASNIGDRYNDGNSSMSLLVYPSEYVSRPRTMYFSQFPIHDHLIKTNLCSWIKSSRMRLAGRVARIGEKRNAYRIFVGKPEGKKPLGRRRRR